MAAVSEAMIYNSRMVPSYVSSNGYYGYIPPKNELVEHHINYQQVQLNNNDNNNNNNQLEQHNQQPNVRIANGHSVSVGLSSLQYQHYDEQRYGYNNASDMEIDGNEMYIQDMQHCQNNHCVIPETARRLINGRDSGGGVGALYRMANDNRNNVDTINQHRENRKRSYDEPTAAHHLHGDQSGRMKKLRQEAVVTAAFAMVQAAHGNMDRPRCLMSHHHYA